MTNTSFRIRALSLYRSYLKTVKLIPQPAQQKFHMNIRDAFLYTSLAQKTEAEREQTLKKGEETFKTWKKIVSQQPELLQVFDKCLYSPNFLSPKRQQKLHIIQN